MFRSSVFSAGALLAGLLTNLPASAGHHVLPIDNHVVTADASIRQTWLARAVEALAAMADADALVTAAVLSQSMPDGSAQTIALLDRATAAAPRAADIARLSTALCKEHPPCDALQREARLRRIDPDNGEAWTAALHDASVHADQQRIDEVIGQMAHARRFDLYYHAPGQRFIAALQRIPPPPGGPGDSIEARQQVEIMAIVAAFALPALPDLTHACKPGTPAGDARRGDCHAIALSMERGDSLIANMLGLRLHEWTAHDAADRTKAQQQQNRLRWKMNQLRQIQGAGTGLVANQITAMLAHANEVDGIDARLAEAGLPLNPPADWKPPIARNASGR